MGPSKVLVADGIVCFIGVIFAMIGVIGIPSTNAGQAASAAWSTIKLPSTRVEVHQDEFETTDEEVSASIAFTLSGVCVFLAEHAFENVPMRAHVDHCWQWVELGEITGVTSGTCQNVEAMIPPHAAPLSNIVQGYCFNLGLWLLMCIFTTSGVRACAPCDTRSIRMTDHHLYLCLCSCAGALLPGFVLSFLKMLVAFAAIGLDGNANYPKCTYVIKRWGWRLALKAVSLLQVPAVIYGIFCYIDPDYEQLALILPQIPGVPPDGRIHPPYGGDAYITMEVAQELVRNMQSAFGPAFVCTLLASVILMASAAIGFVYIRLPMAVTTNGGAASDATVELRKQDGASVHAQAGP